jgi:uncharacterized damage-inducible protein DinB
MDRTALEELYAYTEFAWTRYAQVIDEHGGDELLNREAPGSGWPTLRAALVHVVSVYDGWLNGAWALGLGERPPFRREDVRTWSQLGEYREITRATFQRALHVDDAVFHEPHIIEAGYGQERLRHRDILANILLHERGHHGDLNTLLHQLGVPAPLVDYRFFLTRPEEFLVDEE